MHQPQLSMQDKWTQFTAESKISLYKCQKKDFVAYLLRQDQKCANNKNVTDKKTARMCVSFGFCGSHSTFLIRSLFLDRISQHFIDLTPFIQSFQSHHIDSTCTSNMVVSVYVCFLIIRFSADLDD